MKKQTLLKVARTLVAMVALALGWTPDAVAQQPDPAVETLDDGLIPLEVPVGVANDQPVPITVLVAYHSETGNTEKMAQAVAEGARTVSGATVVLKRIGDIAANDLVASDALIVGSPVYFGSMSGEVKTFFDKWRSTFDLFPDRKMRNKVGGAFVTATAFSNGKELTMLTVFAAMLINEMVVVSGGGGFGASATTGPDSPGIDEKEVAEARALGKRVAEVTEMVKRGASR